MTWFFSPIKSTDTNCAELANKQRFLIRPVVTVFPWIAIPKIGSVVCFLGPLGEVGHY